MAEVDIVVGIEIAFIVIIILIQFFQYSQNKARINRLEELYPEKGLEITEIQEAGSLKLVAVFKIFSRGFQRILEATNLYLQKNRGAAADFNILKDISERESDALESEIESTVAMPLYIGLLGTFLGVIIGLVRIAFFEGINDSSIQSFLGGVLIGMASSACGLFLTTITNFQFKGAKLYRDRYKNDYYTFLQAELLPSLNSDMNSSLNSLKTNLDAFNNEFSVNIESFKGTVGNITENLALQKEFLDALERIGYQKMANANIEVFDRLEKSLPVLERFFQSVQETTLLTEKAKSSFSALGQIMDDLRGFREGINGLGAYIKENDTLIDKQVRYLNAYISTAAQATDSMGKHFDKADDAITQFVERRIQTLMEDSRRAAVQIEDYFAKLREDNIHIALARQIDSLKKEIEKVGNGTVGEQGIRSYPVQPVSMKPELNTRELREAIVAAINATKPAKSFADTFAFKAFVYISIAFYSAGFVALLSYLASKIVLNW